MAKRAKVPGIVLTPLELEMVGRAIGFATAGEWPWEPYKKREGKALSRAAEKIAAAARDDIHHESQRSPTKE